MSEHSNQQNNLVVYGRDSCPQSRMLHNSLDRESIVYEWRDITTGEKRYQDELRELTGGNLSVPTVIFADGSVMIEPWPKEVLNRYRHRPKGILAKIMMFFQRNG